MSPFGRSFSLPGHERCQRDYTSATMQEDAIRSTSAVLEDEVDPERLPNVRFIQGCHSSMQVPSIQPPVEAFSNTSRNVFISTTGSWHDPVGRFDGCHILQEHVHAASFVCFNLGFLPGGDRSIISQPATTVAALKAAMAILEPRGIISVLAYVGHPGAQHPQPLLQFALLSDIYATGF